MHLFCEVYHYSGIVLKVDFGMSMSCTSLQHKEHKMRILKTDSFLTISLKGELDWWAAAGLAKACELARSTVVSRASQKEKTTAGKRDYLWAARKPTTRTKVPYPTKKYICTLVYSDCHKKFSCHENICHNKARKFITQNFQISIYIM